MSKPGIALQAIQPCRREGRFAEGGFKRLVLAVKAHGYPYIGQRFTHGGATVYGKLAVFRAMVREPYVAELRLFTFPGDLQLSPEHAVAEQIQKPGAGESRPGQVLAFVIHS